MSLKIFGINGSQGFAQEVAKYLAIDVSKHAEKVFEDSEANLRAMENVRGSDVYVIHSLYGDDKQSAGEKLLNLGFFCGSLKDASAKRITAVCPYLAYARQDRKTESRAPIATKYVAQFLEAMGVSRIITMDNHNLSAFQNAYRIPSDNLEAKLPFINHLVKNEMPKDLVVLSPDSGGGGRTKRFRTSLEKKLGRINQIEVVYFDKERVVETGVVKGDKIVGNVKNKSVIIVDDMIASGSTIKKCADAVVAHGGSVYAVCATHGLFISDAYDNVKDCGKVVVADTVPPFRLGQKAMERTMSAGSAGQVSLDTITNTISNPTPFLEIVSTTQLFAQAIRRNHDGDSISALLED